MSFVQQLKSDILSKNAFDFESRCLELFRYQYENNGLYNKYVSELNIVPGKIKHIESIPYLPISFFKNFKITSVQTPYTDYFESSGTTGSIRSRLYYYDKPFYLQNAVKIFESFFGNISEYSFFFLLPNYLERTNSSLVAMASHFSELSDKNFGGFYLHEQEKLADDLQKAILKKSGKVILWGVTFALLDFCENFEDLYKRLIVFETGGMKGRGREPLRSEVHHIIKQKLHVEEIYSEYGMTELFSQAYTQTGADVFSTPPQMRILIRELEDPITVHEKKYERGGVNVIDLANIDTCAFIETQDLGVLTEEGFQILGRFDNSDIRGCSLMVLDN